MPNSTPDMPDIIAHRGASAVAPENSMAAFRKAMEMGADWLELDCRLTRDGRLAVLHDPDIIRIGGRNVEVVDMDMGDVRALDVGSWFSPVFASERGPALEDVIALADTHIGVYVELKSVKDEMPYLAKLLAALGDSAAPLDEHAWDMLMDTAARLSADSVRAARSVIDIVRGSNPACRIVTQSFSPVIATVFRREAPDLRFELLGMDLSDQPDLWRDYVAFGERINVAGFNINKESMTEARVRYFHEQGRSCAVWVVDEPEDMVACARCGADAIITNKPDLCRDVLHRLNA